MSQLQSSLGAVASSSGRRVAAGAAADRAARAPRVLGEDAVHRALRAEIAALVEQRRVDLGRRQIDEPRLVQHVEHGAPLRGAERAVAAPPRRGGRGLGPAPAVVGGLRQPERGACRRDAEPGAEIGHRLHHSRSSGFGSWHPQQRRDFFLEFNEAFGALGARRCHRVFSRSSSATFRSTRDRGTFAARPALLGREPGQLPAARAPPPRRQMRRVQPLAAQQGADLARLRARVGLGARPCACTRR